jgi:molybdate transport system substrate-binding protein
MRAPLFACVFTILSSLAWAEQVTVAVASNFLVTARDVAAAFSAETGVEVRLVHGSTGKLFAQIRSGAPYDVYLAADQARPARLKDLGDAQAVKSYAIGQLALVHGEAVSPGDLDDLLARPGLRFAIADPSVAPFGAAAREVLQNRRGAGWDRNLVMGENVGQAFTFVATGNADAGLVALSQPRSYDGRIWVLALPPGSHAPIVQDAALLARAADNANAQSFFDFLSSDFAQIILADAGYLAPGGATR